MSKNRKALRCPYCGGEMERHEPLDWIIYWRCATCTGGSPKEAARIFLRVTEVLPELDMYMHCWVWVIKFERCEKPEK